MLRKACANLTPISAANAMSNTTNLLYIGNSNCVAAEYTEGKCMRLRVSAKGSPQFQQCTSTCESLQGFEVPAQ